MFAALSAAAGNVLSFVSGYVPAPVTERAQQVTEVAARAVTYLTAPPPPQSTSTLPLVVLPRVGKSIGTYQDFKTRVEAAYERDQLLRNLRLKPKVSKACLINDYLSVLSKSKTTHKIYDKLKTKWGYKHFHRTLDTGSKGLASAFIMHVLLEDSPKATSIIHDRLIAFFESVHKSKKYPPLQEHLRSMIDAMHQGSSQLNTIIQGEACQFMDTLAGVLVQSFYEKLGYSEDLTFDAYVESLTDATLKGEIKATLALLDGAPTAPLVPLLGPKQSFFGHNPLRKFTVFKENLPRILGEVRTLLKAHIDAPVVQRWIDELDPMKLLIAFEVDPIAMPRKEVLKPRMIELFKEQTRKYLVECQSTFTEGFGFSQRAASGNLCSMIADELTTMEGAYLLKLCQVDTKELHKIAQALESFEEELAQRQVQFIEHLSNLFNISFVVHSWQISNQDKKRLKLQHVGNWFGPTCHLVLFPENNTSRVDLLKPHGQYAARSDLIDLIRSASFRKFKRHGSETLASIADISSSASPQDKLLAKHFLYYRLHIFACLQKLIYQKLPLLKDKTRFDSCGAKEDDSASYNPFGEDNGDLLPTFHSDVESQTFRIEKHLSGLNREIAELAYIADCVFSHTKHEEIISEIQLLLRAAKKATWKYYISKIPDFLAGFKGIITACQAEATRLFTHLKTQSAAYTAVNPTKAASFDTLIAKARIEDVTHQEIIPLVPRLMLEMAPPSVFGDFNRLKKMIDVYQEASMVDMESLEREILELFAEINRDDERFLAFYPDASVTFRTLFNHPRPLDVRTEHLNVLIPKEKLTHAEIQKIVGKLILLSQKIGKRTSKLEALAEEKVAQIEALRTQIVSKRATFLELNPTKAALFDRIMAEEHAYNINRSELAALKRVPKAADEDCPMYKELKDFYNIMIKLRGYIKETAKLEEKHLMLQAKAGGEYAEVDIYDTDDEEFPEAGSLGSFDGDAASLGGASYSSELRSIGSVEKWINGLL